MKLALISTLLATANAFTYSPTGTTSPTTSLNALATKADLVTLAEKSNPVLKYYDPLQLASTTIYGESQDASIAWLRQAEIKHGRVAMAAFVGFLVQSNGIHFPWASTLSGLTYSDIAAAGSPAAQWDILPTAAKLQIIGFVGFLELWGEGAIGDDHYMKGGKPGLFPSFAPLREKLGHPAFDLFDPFGFSKNKTPEQKERGLLIELNNGRLAMIGIFGFLAAASVEGSVPFLSGKIAHYDGEVMAPFAAGDQSLLFVSDMLKFPHLDSWAKLFPTYWN